MEINDELLEGTFEEVENSSMDEESMDDNVEDDSINNDMHEVVESHTLNKENKPKGENIYVENDISGLERMLGISSKNTESDEDSDIDSDDDIMEDDKNELNDLDVVSSDHSALDEEDDSTKDMKDSKKITNRALDSVRNVMKALSEPEEDNNNDDVGNSVELEIKDNEESKPVLLSDFMDTETDSFTFLERCEDGYSLCSLSLEDKKDIKRAVRSPNYIFRYPRLTLRDSVLGYKENKSDSCIHYNVYFPDYSLSFDVPCDYVKPYTQTFRSYFEDLVSRRRPDHLSISYYNDSITISALKVLETGLLELNTENGSEKYLIDNPDLSFYAVLDYIRGLSDQGSEHIELKMIPAYFRKI